MRYLVNKGNKPEYIEADWVAIRSGVLYFYKFDKTECKDELVRKEIIDESLYFDSASGIARLDD